MTSDEQALNEQQAKMLWFSLFEKPEATAAVQIGYFAIAAHWCAIHNRIEAMVYYPSMPAYPLALENEEATISAFKALAEAMELINSAISQAIAAEERIN